MKRAFFFAAGLLLALSPAQVDAQLYGGTVTGGNAYLNSVTGSGQVAYGVHVGAYTGNFNNDGFGDFSIYCVDFLHSAQRGNVYVSQMSGNLSSTRFGQNLSAAAAQVRYQQTAYLASLFGTTNPGAWGDIHAAIWQISSGQTLGNDVARQDYVDEAMANYASVNLSDWYVITPLATQGALDGYLQSGDGYGQEFLMRRASVPEPATLFLMLTGLVMLVGVNRKRILAIQDL